jgi:hypothetical protein
VVALFPVLVVQAPKASAEAKIRSSGLFMT